MRHRVGFSALSAVLLLASWAGAQSQEGSIFIRVQDEQGGVVPGARASVSSPVLINDQVGETGSDGRYRFVNLRPGVYSLRAELSGFQSYRREGVIVNAARTATVDVQLAVGDLSETVQVVGESPVIDITTNTVSTTITEEILQDTPGAHDLWSLLEYKVPSLISSRPDVGGSESGLQAGFVAKGAPHGQNTQAINGVNVSDPEAIGFADFYYDYDSFDEVEVSTGGHSVEVGAPGVYVNMVTKTGTERWQGQVAGYYQGDSTQSDNIDAQLQQQGIQKAGFDFLSDVTAQIGGPVVKDRLRLFTSWRDWRVHRFVAGFEDASGTPVVESTDMFSWLFDVTYQPAAGHTFSAFWTRQTYDKPQRGASGLNTPLSNWKEDDVFDVYQAAWNGVLGPSVVAEARVSYVDIFFPLYIKDEAKAQGLQSTLETTTNRRTGSNNQEFIFERRRLQAKGSVSIFKDNWAGGRHEFKLGLDLFHSPNEVTNSHIDEVNLTTTSGRANTVTLFDGPVNIKRNVDSLALFASDRMVYDDLTITAGVRLERTKGSLPAQSSPPSVNFPNANRSFPAIDDVPNWTTLAPRVGFVWDATGDGKTAVKGNYARYFYQISAGLPNQVNPNGANSEVYTWSDLNGDLRFQPGETGTFLGASGGLFTSMADDIAQPRSDEFTVALDRELFADFRGSVSFTYRRDRQLIGIRNAAAIWNPVTAIDSVTGSSITVFEQDRSTIGRNAFLVDNADSLDIDYKGVELVLSKRMSKNWQMLTSYTLSKSEQGQANDQFGTGVPSVDPNDQVNAAGPTFWDRTHTFKTSAMYEFPAGLRLSTNVRIQSGQPFSRQIVVPLAQGNVVVNAEPRGERRYPSIFTLDLRLSKIFRFGDRRSAELMVDAYNVTNENTGVSFNERTGPAFEFPLQILAPRIVRFGAKFIF